MEVEGMKKCHSSPSLPPQKSNKFLDMLFFRCFFFGHLLSDINLWSINKAFFCIKQNPIHYNKHTHTYILLIKMLLIVCLKTLLRMAHVAHLLTMCCWMVIVEQKRRAFDGSFYCLLCLSVCQSVCQTGYFAT